MRLLAGRALRLSVALAGMLTAAGAFAHAHLQQQIPTAGAQLSASPQTLTLSFSEGIEPAFSGVYRHRSAAACGGYRKTDPQRR